MNEENRKKWVAALRSGKYNQDKHGLAILDRDTGQYGYCCLGVLCQVAMENGVDVEFIAADEGVNQGERYGTFDGEGLMPPTIVNEWIGVTGSLDYEIPDEVANRFIPEERQDDGEYGLAGLNDEYGLDFNAIADVIEAAYP